MGVELVTLGSTFRADGGSVASSADFTKHKLIRIGEIPAGVGGKETVRGSIDWG